MEPKSINTAYTVSANMPLSHNLGKNVANISIEKPPYRGEPCHFIATADLPQKTGNIVNIDNTFTQKYNENFENVLNQKYTVITEHNFNNDSLLNNSYITKFYIGSISIVGLYIFYRILVKNK